MDYKDRLISFGLHVRQLREANDWSQEDLAFESEIGRATIQRIEQGKQNTSLKMLMMLAKTFRISLKDLVDF